jgi:hypothetical protein
MGLEFSCCYIWGRMDVYGVHWVGIANAVSRPTPGALVNSRVRSDTVCRRRHMQSGTNCVRVFAIQAHGGRNSRSSPGKVDKFQSSNL